VVLRWLNPYTVGHYRLEVANYVFNDMGTSGLVALPRCTRLAACHHAVGSLCTIVVSDEWSTGTMLHCSCTIAACSHVLQTLVMLPSHMSCRPMMALTSGAMETSTRALGTCEPSCTDRPVRLFFMFETHGPQGIVGRVIAQSPPSREVGSRAAGHSVH
jgi:hypothetical protein